MYNEEISNKEIRKLTVAAIRVAESFCGGEILKNKIQEKALDIFSKSNPHIDAALLKDVKLLKQFINLAKDLRLTKPINCEVLIREYNKIYELAIDNIDSLKAKADSSESEIIVKPITNIVHRKKKVERKREDNHTQIYLNERQRKIISLFANKKELRLKDVGKSLRGVTSRTLRNDLRKLVGVGKLKHNGAGAGSIYTLKSKG
jgi:hypothetical protein